MISKFFIERPVLANVLAIVFVLIGGVALYTLPIAQYPNVVPPTISVTTTYPGASADTVMKTVALPIEEQVNGVEHMIYMQSTSASDGTYSLIVTFDIGTNLDFDQVLVQNRVSIALAQLPDAVQSQGVNVQQKSTSILQIVSLTSKDGRYDSLYLSNYGTINLVSELARLPGVGNVNVFGVGQYSMRIWLDPDKLHSRGLTAEDVATPSSSRTATWRRVRSACHRHPSGRIPIHHQCAGPPRGRPASSRTSSSRSTAARRPYHAGVRCRPGRARRPDLSQAFTLNGQGRRRHRDLSVPRTPMPSTSPKR